MRFNQSSGGARQWDCGAEPIGNFPVFVSSAAHGEKITDRYDFPSIAGANLYSKPGEVYRMRMSVNSGEELDHYKKRIAETLRELGIPESFATGRRQTPHRECEDLVSIGLDLSGREQRLERVAAISWQAMRQAAESAGVTLAIVSAFRSFDYQRQIIARKLAAGQSIERILSVSALPGFSEHHSGRAIDVGTPGCPPVTEAFETTDAYAWLTSRAHEFGFTLSYPRGNPHGIMFEPWHWVFSGAPEKV